MTFKNTSHIKMKHETFSSKAVISTVLDERETEGTTTIETCLYMGYTGGQGEVNIPSEDKY